MHNEQSVGEAKLLVTNEGVFVNQLKIDKTNNPPNEKKHIYSRQKPENNAEKKANERKAQRIIAFKQRRDGFRRCPHTSKSLSPDRGAQDENLAPVSFDGVPLSNV